MSDNILRNTNGFKVTSIWLHVPSIFLGCQASLAWPLSTWVIPRRIVCFIRTTLSDYAENFQEFLDQIKFCRKHALCDTSSIYKLYINIFSKESVIIKHNNFWVYYNSNLFEYKYRWVVISDTCLQGLTQMKRIIW